jgi:hypothetical protein
MPGEAVVVRSAIRATAKTTKAPPDKFRPDGQHRGSCSALVEELDIRRITAVSRIPGNGRIRQATGGHHTAGDRAQRDTQGVRRTREDTAPTWFGTVRLRSPLGHLTNSTTGID